MTDKTQIVIVSGDGDTAETPIKFSPCDRAARIAAEYRYICNRFGVEDVDWNRGIHFTRIADSGLLSDWNIQISAGTYKSVYFDTGNTDE